MTRPRRQQSPVHSPSPRRALRPRSPRRPPRRVNSCSNLPAQQQPSSPCAPPTYLLKLIGTPAAAMEERLLRLSQRQAVQRGERQYLLKLRPAPAAAAAPASAPASPTKCSCHQKAGLDARARQPDLQPVRSGPGQDRAGAAGLRLLQSNAGGAHAAAQRSPLQLLHANAQARPNSAPVRSAYRCSSVGLLASVARLPSLLRQAQLQSHSPPCLAGLPIACVLLQTSKCCTLRLMTPGRRACNLANCWCLHPASCQRASCCLHLLQSP